MTSLIFQDVKEDFNKRSKEVSKYFIFLKSLEQGTTKLSMGNENKKIKTLEIEPDLEKTLKASSFLLLYNLVEATMRNAIEAIFDELNTQSISFDQVRPEIRKIVLKNIKNLKESEEENFFSEISNISVGIINAKCNTEKLFSGNIDHVLINNTAKAYGFSFKTNYAKTGHGKDLEIVKVNRNYLAHGNKSFTEVGREKSARELVELKNKVIRYLKQILLNIEIYLNNQEYLYPFDKF